MSVKENPIHDPLTLGEEDRVVYENVINLLSSLQPILQSEGGDARVIGFEAGVVHIELAGGCEGCGGGVAQLLPGLKMMLMEKIPGLKGVEFV